MLVCRFCCVLVHLGRVYLGLWPINIISLILSSQSLEGAKMGNPREKPPDHPQAELGLSHIWPEQGSNPQGLCSGSPWKCRKRKNNDIVFTAYRKFPKYSDTKKNCCNHSKIWTIWLYHRVMSPNDAGGMANSVDPDQTAPLGAVWSGSALFAQTCLSENLGSIRYLSHQAPTTIDDLDIQNFFVCSGLTSLSTIFQSYHDGVWLRQGAQCSLL